MYIIQFSKNKEKRLILFITSEVGFRSGVQRASIDIISALSNRYSLLVITSKYKINNNDIDNAKNVNVILGPKNKKFNNNNLFNILKNIYWKLVNINRYKNILKYNYNKIDLVIVNSYSFHIFDIIKSKLSVKNVFISHGSPYSLEYPGSQFSLNDVKKYMETFNYLVFVSNIVRNQWLQKGNFKDKKTFYLPNCSNENVIIDVLKQKKSEIKNKCFLRKNHFNVVCVANIMYRKGQDLLVNNYSKILNISKNIHIYFIGNYQNDWANILMKRSKDFDNLHFVGIKRNAIEYIYCSDLFILPSRNEALPLVILEAMALGVPIIASNVNGIPELIEDNVTGLLFNSENEKELLNKLKDIYFNNKKREEVGKNAKEKYWKFFNKDRFNQRYLDMIEEILI